MRPALHPDVLAIGRRFRAVGMSTPFAVKRKGALLLSPNFKGERVAIVVADVVRCSTTILAALAGGAGAVVVTTKNNGGPGWADARRAADQSGLEIVSGGELGGRPVEGGLIGNSPRDVRPDMFDGKLLYFQSTNFAAAFIALQPIIQNFVNHGGSADLYVGSFANVAAIAAQITAEKYSRVFIATGGFYDAPSLEDMIFGGDLLLEIGVTVAEMDDDCRAMFACAREFASSADRITALRNNWIGQSLANFGMAADIDAVVLGEGIAPGIYARMKTLVPIAGTGGGVPFITPRAPTGPSCQMERKITNT